MALRDAGYAIHVDGLKAFQGALKRAEGTLDVFVRERLKAMAEPIRTGAAGRVEHKTGRHSAPPGHRLEDTLKLSATQRAVSVYSNTLWSGVQDRGGKVGHGTILTRAEVSGYLSKATEAGMRGVESELVGLGGEIEAELER